MFTRSHVHGEDIGHPNVACLHVHGVHPNVACLHVHGARGTPKCRVFTRTWGQGYTQMSRLHVHGARGTPKCRVYTYMGPGVHPNVDHAPYFSEFDLLIKAHRLSYRVPVLTNRNDGARPPKIFV